MMRRWLCLLPIVIALFGCGLLVDDRVDADDSDVTGTWRDSMSQVTIVLHASKSFEASDVAPLFVGCAPTCMPSDLGGAAIKGSGTWKVGPSTGREGPSNYVHLLVTKVEHEQLSRFIPSDRAIRIERDKDKVLYLAIYHGDPDLNDKSRFYKQ